MPSRQAFVVQMIERREDLGNAIALNSSMVHVARLLGPSIAGLVIAAVGEGYCFLIDGFSYIAVILSLLAMRIAALPQARKDRAVLHDLKEGWIYATGSVPIRSILLLLALVSVAGVPYTTLMPIVAGAVLHGGPHTLGFLMGASGAGALISAMLLAARRSVSGLERVVAVAAAVFGAGLIGVGSSRQLWLSLLLMPIAGGAMMQQAAASNTILQTIVHEDKRGRVMSFFSMAFMGMAPFGSLLAGSLASKIGAPKTLVLGGAICILGAGWFAHYLPTIRERGHPLEREQGVIPEVARGVESAAALQTPPEE
jgi:MFS family permease